MKRRYIVVDTDKQLDPTDYKGVEVIQSVDEDQIDMLLLNDLVSETSLVFLGFQEAQRLSKKYGGTLLVNEGELLTFLYQT